MIELYDGFIVIQLIINGIIAGSIYALIAIGPYHLLVVGFWLLDKGEQIA